MSKQMNNEASEKSGDQCKGMEAKRDSESAQVDVHQSAFEGVGDDAELLPATRTAQVRASHEAAFQHSNSDERTDLADHQRRDVKASASPSPDEVKDRLIAARRRGPDRPLGHLAWAEDDLHARSAALTKLSSPQQKQPDKGLLVHQLTRAVNTSHVPKTMAPKLRSDAVALYSALQSSDPTDSILNRLTVAMTNSVMDCHARAAQAGNPQAIDTNLRHAVKGTNAVIDLVEARERRRGPKQITVGKVNVEAGGQAIVGNVETRKQRPLEKENRPDPSLANDEETGD
jgi:hypothetical protein